MGCLKLDTKAAVLAFVDKDGQRTIYHIGDRDAIRKLYEVFAMTRRFNHR